MGQLDDSALTELGREAAQLAGGPDVIDAVEVSASENRAGEPIYHFWYHWTQEPDRQRIGLLRLKLGRALRDRLVARGDFGNPLIHILSGQDWEISRQNWDKRLRA